MSIPLIGQISMFAGNFPPVGWAFCNGQLLPISGNETLFTLIGTTYGGDGQSNFALPNLQSRLPVHQGQGSGLSNYAIGQAGGSQAVTVLQNMLPTHSHTLNASSVSATAAAIGSSVLPAIPTVSGAYAYAGPTVISQTLAVEVCGIAGASLPHNNLMPSLCISFIIALQGAFPSRN